MTGKEAHSQRSEGWLDKRLNLGVRIDIETLIYVALILLAIVTRFHDLETRVMSHDESLHTYFSWTLAERGSYEHSPMMHGPLQFHLVALSYFAFGDSDASARIPAAAASVLAVGMVILFRKWLGRKGALVAAALMTISPYMLYYGRYVRNEALVLPQALLMVYAVIRYFETRQSRWLYFLSLSLVLHFTTKETSFIYTVQLLLFLVGYLSWQLLRQSWRKLWAKVVFAVGLVVGVAGAGMTIYGLLRAPIEAAQGVGETLQPLDPTAGITIGVRTFPPLVIIGVILVLAGLVLVGTSLLVAFGRRLRSDFPAMDLLLVTGTMVLPLSAALPARMLGWDPLAYTDPESFLRTKIAVLGLALIAVAIGLLWNWRRWLIVAAVFYGPFLALQTTFFTNPSGAASGLVGSLGYWLAQHNVERGGQPWYYYIAVQIPMYEYLPAVGSLLAVWAAFRRSLGVNSEQAEDSAGRESPHAPETAGVDDNATPASRFPAILFLGWWAASSLVAYSFAGERMPWLTVHIALPMILLSGWSIGTLLDSIPWREWWERRVWLVALLLIVTLVGLGRSLSFATGSPPPFQGNEMSQLIATMGFIISLVVGLGGIVGLFLLSRDRPLPDLFTLTGLLALILMTVLTFRTALRAAFANYDDATEYMVYAHSATGVKTVLSQVEDLSLRTTDGLGIDVAYDNDVSWPMTWYLRNYTNSHFYGGNPTRELLQYPLVIVGNDNWSRVDDILGDRFYEFEYIRMWWPMQDYYGLTWQRVWNALKDPDMRRGLWEIWLNRDYTEYGRAVNRDFSLSNWSPADRMRLYIRKDIAGLIWDYGVAGETFDLAALDPYQEGMVDLWADEVIGETGAAPGQLFRPRSVAVASDGSIYVADSLNHRIQHFDRDGALIESWGSFSDTSQGSPAPGTFNEPWGVAVAPNGDVYVADTWNHRIQHFTSDGQFLGMFGFYGRMETLDAFYGPRGIAVDAQGRVFVADTGNKRIVVFDEAGHPLGEITGAYDLATPLDEPVGVAIDDEGYLYVADTWNQRIVVFVEAEELDFWALAEWPVEAWYGNSAENKPYLAVSPLGYCCATDPEGDRVLCFEENGEFQLGWGQYYPDMTQFGLPSGIAFDAQGGAWLADSENNRLLHFSLELESGGDEDTLPESEDE